MTGRSRQALTAAVLTFITSAACHRGPQSQPGDPMLDAIRAEEREGNLTYAESQGRSSSSTTAPPVMATLREAMVRTRRI